MKMNEDQGAGKVINQYQLKNGMQVILLSSHKSPVVSVQAWVRTGSVHENQNEKGVSHFLEHLVFKGSKDFKVGEIAGAVEACGGEINAYTSFEQTVYYVTLSSQDLETGLKVISNMVGFPTLDPVEIDNERGVVIEEIKKGHDSLGRVGSQLLFKNAYQGHPLGIPVIGYDKVIEKIKPAQIKDYMSRRYDPKNMFLLIAGDIEPKDVKPLINESFGKISVLKKSKAKPPKDLKLKAPAAPKIAIEKTKFSQSLMYFSWRTPGPADKEMPGLDVLAAILGQGESSRLLQRLRLQEPLALSTGSSVFSCLKQGLFLISVAFQQENYSKILGALEEELLRIWTEGVGEEEIRKSVNNILSDEAYSLETVDGLARRYGGTYFYLRDLRGDLKYKQRLLKLTVADINKLARKYLNPKNLIFSLATSGEAAPAKEETKKWVKSLEKKFSKAKATKASAKKIKHAQWKFPKNLEAEPVKVIDLPNGDRVLLKRDQSTPVISAKGVFLGGLRLEPADKNGLTELVSRTWTAGTTKRDELAISKELDMMAAQLQSVGGRNSWGLSMDLLSSFEKTGVDLFVDSLVNPVFPKEILERERLVMIQQLKNRKDQPGQVCGVNFTREMFKGHPYSRDFMGTEESLMGITREDLSRTYFSDLKAHRRHFTVTGNFSEKIWMEALEKVSEGLGKGTQKVGEWKKLPVLEPLKKQQLIFEKQKKEQTHLIMGWRGLTMTDEKRYVLHLIQSILAGQGGRLFIELRDKKSLAYSVAPMRMEGIDGGYFGAYIACSPEKLDTAIDGILTEFEKLKQESVPQGEIDRSKRYLIGRHEIDLQRNGSIAGGLIYNDVYGLDYQETFDYRRHMEPITAHDIQKVARELFQGPQVVSVVGPKPPKGA